MDGEQNGTQAQQVEQQQENQTAQQQANQQEAQGKHAKEATVDTSARGGVDAPPRDDPAGERVP